MSIEFENGDLPELGKMELSCDFPKCKTWTYFDGDFRECIQIAKGEGWAVFKIEDGWVHYCPAHAKYKDRP